MKSASFSIKKVHILSIDIEEDVLDSIREFVARTGIKQGVVMGGYGTLASDHLHWVKHNRLPSENLFGKNEGGIEILSMNGLIADGEPHVHVTLATPKGAYGGHLEEGCRAYVLCEVFIGEAEGIRFTHKWEDKFIPGMGSGKVIKLLFDGE